MSIAEPFAAARQSFAVFRQPNRVLVEFTGEDRGRFLHNFCTNDIKSLALNAGCEVIFTNIKARAMGHGYVFAGETAHWIETVVDGLDGLLKHLDKYLITDDVEFTRREDIQQILVTGPEAVSAVAVALQTTDAINNLTQIAVGDLWVRRVDCFQEPGILVAGSEDALSVVIKQLGKQPACDDSYEAVRVEAGFPLYGTDISEDHLAPEAGRVSQTISYRKGCYLGQEPIARIDALGHVNKSLCSVEVSGSEIPAVGSVLKNLDGDEVGTVSSSAPDPQDNTRCFALAWLKSAHTTDGAEVKLGDRVVTVRKL